MRIELIRSMKAFGSGKKKDPLLWCHQSFTRFAHCVSQTFLYFFLVMISEPELFDWSTIEPPQVLKKEIPRVQNWLLNLSLGHPLGFFRHQAASSPEIPKLISSAPFTAFL